MPAFMSGVLLKWIDGFLSLPCADTSRLMKPLVIDDIAFCNLCCDTAGMFSDLMVEAANLAAV